VYIYIYIYICIFLVKLKEIVKVTKTLTIFKIKNLERIYGVLATLKKYIKMIYQMIYQYIYFKPINNGINSYFCFILILFYSSEDLRHLSKINQDIIEHRNIYTRNCCINSSPVNA